MDGTTSVWTPNSGENHHLRIVTTNNGYNPGIIDAPTFINNDVVINNTASKVIDVDNIGDYSLDYDASIEYIGYPGMKFADIDIQTNDFETALVYTNTGAWSRITGLTGYCAGVTSQGVSTLTSTTFDGTLATNLYVDFDQASVVRTGGYANVEYYNGSAWVQVSNQTASSTSSLHVAIPNTATQIRFVGNITRSSGQTGSWRIDNVRIYGPENIIFNWMTIDGGTTTSGTIAAQGTDQLTVGYDATGLMFGDYIAKINYTSEFSNGSSLVTMTVVESGTGPIIPAVPAPVTTSIVGSNLVIEWDDSADATGYDVYASDDPYGTFSVVASVGTSQYTVAADQAKLFYKIVATNATKIAPIVKINKSNER
jgi:hypothetical protein